MGNIRFQVLTPPFICRNIHNSIRKQRLPASSLFIQFIDRVKGFFYFQHFRSGGVEHLIDGHVLGQFHMRCKRSSHVVLEAFGKVRHELAPFPCGYALRFFRNNLPSFRCVRQTDGKASVCLGSWIRRSGRLRVLHPSLNGLYLFVCLAQALFLLTNWSRMVIVKDVYRLPAQVGALLLGLRFGRGRVDPRPPGDRRRGCGRGSIPHRHPKRKTLWMRNDILKAAADLSRRFTCTRKEGIRIDFRKVCVIAFPVTTSKIWRR